MTNTRWQDMSRTQQVTVVSLAAVEIVVTAVALRDLYRRPARLVRGPKPLWAAACFVQPVGPVAYLLAGRRTTAPA